MKLKVAIFGGSGYGGSELLRILLPHPHAEIAFVTANEHAGKLVSDVHRNLYGLTELRFEPAPEELSKLADLDCVFFALPHGQALALAPQLPASVEASDLSGDFWRPAVAEFLLRARAVPPDVDPRDEFGLAWPEPPGGGGPRSRLISNPGCFATA